MAELFDKQAEIYLDARPTYPADWYSKLASLTTRHALAWDVGTGNGQAAVGVAEHYDRVIATDVSEAQLRCAMRHPKVTYRRVLQSIPDDDLVSLIGGEGSVDLITVAQAVHWFNLPRFYSVASRLLRKPGGVIALWCYNDIEVTPEFDAMLKGFHDTTLPYWDPNVRHVFSGYKDLPFPFRSVGMGREGEPVPMDIPKVLSFEGLVGMLRSWSAVVTARDRGVDLLSEEVVKGLEEAWGGPDVVRPIIYKALMLAGAP
ncbi:hypothetical protein MLD38_028418 [Melastoma candidum]|uniref:Uncharacterized protein n=1 Tax=Melastoma candidum TaxID=119954 RepID=A0ACB9N1I7_9MYRT|nr:hypothetical protein MLD38_028418 [Melastoma candidum]